jgi:hypothetical protein
MQEAHAPCSPMTDPSNNGLTAPVIQFFRGHAISSGQEVWFCKHATHEFVMRVDWKWRRPAYQHQDCVRDSAPLRWVVYRRSGLPIRHHRGSRAPALCTVFRGSSATRRGRRRSCSSTVYYSTWYCISFLKKWYCFSLSNKDARADPHRILPSSSVSGFHSWLHLSRRRYVTRPVCCCPLRPPVARFRFFALLSLGGKRWFGKRTSRKRRHDELASRCFGSWRRRWSVYY